MADIIKEVAQKLAGIGVPWEEAVAQHEQELRTAVAENRVSDGLKTAEVHEYWKALAQDLEIQKIGQRERGIDFADMNALYDKLDKARAAKGVGENAAKKKAKSQDPDYHERARRIIAESEDLAEMLVKLHSVLYWVPWCRHFWLDAPKKWCERCLEAIDINGDPF